MKAAIDLRKTIPENAEKYYEKAKKNKRKIPGLKQARKKTRKKLGEIRLEDLVREEPVKKKQRKKKWYEKFRWFNSSDGYLVVGGKDATTNDILIKKHMEDDDIVFHANVHGAPFFIIKNPEKTRIPETTLNEAARAAASYSSAWKAGQAAADVYWIKPEQVSKTPPSGEYLPKGAFMIYGRKNWHRKTQLKLRIGYREDEPHVIGGPPEAVEKHAIESVSIQPGDVKSGQTAKQIRAKLLEKGVEDATVDEIQYFIPGGRAKIS